MKFIDAIKSQKKPLISIEIIPPDKGGRIDKIFNSIDKLIVFSPKFINVTNHQPDFVYQEINGEIRKIPKNPKAGTIGVSVAIQNRYHVDSIPHFICGGVNRFQIEDMLIELQYLGIDNIFVVRGDPLPGKREFISEKNGYVHANELIKQISDLNKGIYSFPIENALPTDYCIGAAAYPEKHYEALNMEKDIFYVKKKVDQGAHYIITQMFFNFDYYKKFVKKVREIGIDVPIIPGVKPIVREKFLKTIPRAFFINIPNKLVKAFENARTKKEEFEAGTSYMTELTEKLLDFGVPGIHIFTMGQGKSAYALLDRVFGKNR